MTRPPIETGTELPSVIVLGGGLAGIAAAVRLSARGCPVTLIETRKRLGGRATSFVDPTTGDLLDNCQHVLLRCCTNLLDLYRRLGVEDRIEWHSKLYFQDARGNLDTLEADDLPAPLHTTRSLMAFRTLTWAEKLALSRGMLALMRLGASGRAAWHDRSFADWLASQGQPAGVVRKFWANIVISALNELPERMAADYAIQVFQEAFCATEEAYVMGLPAVPLVQLYDAAEQVIAKAGGRVLLSTSVERLVFDEQGRRVTTVRLSDGRELSADAFVSALPFDRLAKVCSDAMVHQDERLRSLDRIRVSPIIGTHLEFDRAVMDLPHLVLMESPLQWLFNKGMDSSTGSQHIHGVISAAHDLVDVPTNRIADLVVAEVRNALPAAGNAGLLHVRVVKEKRATFSIEPGVDRFRPAARGAIGNLSLAGDWCRTGWPATMEGAVRSGYLAAAAALNDAGVKLEPDLTPAPMYLAIAGS